MEVKIIGQMDNTLDHTFESANRVYDKEQLCPTIPTCAGGNIQPKIIEEKICVAMRGRNPEKPTDRTAGLPTKQRLELNSQGIVNTLTTVQKDNMVLEAKTTRGKDIFSTIRSSYYKNGERNIVENVKNGNGYEGVIEIKQATKEGTIKCKVGGCYDASFPGSATRRGRVQEGGDVAPTLTAGSNENIRYVETIYRIRKLTPRECWRLMGYTDADFDNAEKVNSNTQLYKQAGNAIVKQVLMAIFAQMIPESARQK